MLDWKQMQARFEGREAIYVEKGAVRVRVLTIRPGPIRPSVSVELELIPTPGVPAVLGRVQLPEQPPFRWTISVGHLSTVSGSFWSTPYSYSLYFAPAAIQRVVETAAGFSEDLSVYDRYKQILRIVEGAPGS